MNITEYNSISSEHILTNEYRRVNLDINPFINYRGSEGWFKRTKQAQALSTWLFTREISITTRRRTQAQ